MQEGRLQFIIKKIQEGSTERYILLGITILLPLLLLLEVSLHMEVMRYKSIRLLLAGTAFLTLCLSYFIQLVNTYLPYVVTLLIYILTSHAIFLNYVNNFSYYYASILVSTVIICSFYFRTWKSLLVYQLSMIVILLQASLLTEGAQVNILMFLGFYSLLNVVVFLIQLYIFKKQEKLDTVTRQLQQSAVHLQETNKSLEQFAYIASHDLKEPLRTVNSYLGLLTKKYADKLDSDTVEFVAICTEATKRMQIMIDGLLKYSRTTTGAMDKTQINLNELVHEVLENMETSIRESNANIEVDTLPVIHGDRVQLTQLFQNLISNAIKYRSEADPIINIQTHAADDTSFIISISDNGLGLPKTYSEKIFGMFSRFHTDKADGSGIGLAICKKIAANHNGNIWVESEEGRGSSFFITLNTR
jgi:signal transduction histidine kinase